MTRMRRRLIDDFLLPALNNNKYPGKLDWVDKEIGIFRLYWSHKNAAKWQSEDTIVFQDWDKLKGHFRPEVTNYFMSAKQRFRAALYKLNKTVKPLKSDEKFYRDYQLKFEIDDKKQNENLSRPKAKGIKRSNQCEIRPSVICKNTSYIAKAKSVAVKKERKSPSPAACYKEEKMIIAEYSSSMEKIHQLKRSRQYETIIPQIAQKYTKEVHATSILRENSSIPRVSHIAPQPVPVYSFKHNQLRTHEVHNAPHVMVSSCHGLSYIFAGPENVIQTKDDSQSSVDSTDGILNLSLKSNVSDTPSR